MTTETPNYDPAFFQRIHEQDKENISELKRAIEQLPDVKRRLFEMHDRYTKTIQDLKTQISREKNVATKKLLAEKLDSYEASLEHIKPAYRTQYVALQATLMNNLIKIQAVQDVTERSIKDKNPCVEESYASATKSSAMQKR